MSERRQFEVGDEVYEVSSRRIEPAVIERVTRTQAITAAGGRYQRVGGRMVGRDTWSSTHIVRPAPYLDRRYAEQCLSDAESRLENAAARGCDPQEIRAAFAVWDKLEKEVNGE